VKRDCDGDHNDGADYDDDDNKMMVGLVWYWYHNDCLTPTFGGSCVLF